MDDINIEILEEEVLKSEGDEIVALPMNFITVGDVDRDSVQVYIKQDVYKRIEKFAKEDISKEVGSILLGDYIEDGDRKIVVISSYIEAKYTDASASTLTFTHKTWDYVYKEKEANYFGEKIVGWQHTHPGYGIFLSNYDIFIQENFFNLPWQIAYVVDPIADTRGFFEWKNGKVSKMTGFYIYDEVGREIKISEKAKPKKNNISLVNIILSFALVVMIILAISFNIEKNNIMDKLEMAINELANTRNQINNSVEIIEENNKEISTENIKSFKIYTIKNISEIMKINDIKDSNKIYVGQKIYLPLSN